MSDITVKERLYKIRSEPDIIPISEIPCGLFNRIDTHIHQAEAAARLAGITECWQLLVTYADTTDAADLVHARLMDNPDVS